MKKATAAELARGWGEAKEWEVKDLAAIGRTVKPVIEFSDRYHAEIIEHFAGEEVNDPVNVGQMLFKLSLKAWESGNKSTKGIIDHVERAFQFGG